MTDLAAHAMRCAEFALGEQVFRRAGTAAMGAGPAKADAFCIMDALPAAGLVSARA